MATRRARLQVKPNIGGPKGPATKPPASKKPPVKEASSSETVKEPSTSKLKDLSNSKDQNLTSTISDEVSTDTKKKQETEEKSLSQENVKAPVKESGDTVLIENNKNDGITSPPSRARLRRFGKVNLSAIRGTPSESGAQKTDSAHAGDSCNSTSSVKEITTEAKSTSDSNTEETSTKNDKDKESVEKKPIPRRSRFPKAKPNVMEAGKRRQRPSESTAKKEDTEKDSISNPSKTTATVPAIVVSPPDEPLVSELPKTATAGSLNSTTADISETVQMTQIQQRPSIPRSPMKTPVSPAVLTSPVKQMHGADKRQRTISVSEAPVIKRAKKPRVDAPTDKPPNRTTMRMRDLIHWNPKNNPMKPKVKTGTTEIVAAVEKENVEKERPEPPSLDISEDSNSSMPVPQVTIGPDGNIVINEQSLVVQNPDEDKDSLEEEAVIDETDMITTYRSFRKVNVSKRWSNKETAKFYKALGMIGIDFTLINKLFPNRSRFEIKKKFKCEERKNKPLIDKVLKQDVHFDPAVFDARNEESSSDEEDVIKKKGKKEKKGGKKKKDEEDPKQRKKREKKPLNYYDDSHSEEEEGWEPVNPKVGEDSPWQPPCVSQKDGEVVGILMDMSEGRLSADGSQIENTMLLANPLKQTNAHHNDDKRTPSSSATQPVTPGIQSIISIQTQPIISGASGTNNMQNKNIFTAKSAATASGSLQNISFPATSISTTLQSNGSNRVVLNSSSRAVGACSVPSNWPSVSEHAPLRTETGIQTDIVQNQTVYQPSTQLATSTYIDDSVSHTVMPDSLPGAAVNISSGPDDQYVLVTVMPEGGEETVVHIYKIHPGSGVEGTDNQTVNTSLDSGVNV